MRNKFCIDVSVPQENQIEFKRDFEALAQKHYASLPSDGFFIDDDSSEESDDCKKQTEPKDNKYLTMMMMAGLTKPKPKLMEDDPDFDNLKTNCWKSYGFQKNIIGERFQDDPDHSDLFHKIIGFQVKNKETPIITLDDNGIRRKWKTQQVCMFLGVTTGFTVEELEVTPEDIKRWVKKEKQQDEEQKSHKKKRIIVIDDNTEPLKNDVISVSASSNTFVKCTSPLKIRPKNAHEHINDIIDESKNVRYRRAGTEPMEKKPVAVASPPLHIGPKKTYEELENMNDTELSLYYGFDKNMVGTIFNQPTPKKGLPRYHEITGYNIIKEKYVVVALAKHNNKSIHFSVEQVKELLENEKQENEEQKEGEEEHRQNEEKQQKEEKQQGQKKNNEQNTTIKKI